MKIITILGARPQFIKAAVVSRAIALHNIKCKKQIQEIIIHTNQHYDSNMSEVFFKEMSIPAPKYNLGISDCSHAAMTGRMLEQIEPVILKERPDVVMVYGDTNSTLAGAVAAAKLHIPIAHVEAGLRSFNMNMPEEVNRIITDRVSTFLFCPTKAAVRNLYNEGICNDTIIPNPPLVLNVGDVMYDAVVFYKKISKPNETIRKLIDDIGYKMYLATVHREENTDNSDRLRDIFDALSIISKKTPVVIPIHPRTKKNLNKYGISLKDIQIIDPVGYFDMIALLEHCKAVFTDSGGLQKEAFFFHKPCITLRDETEWSELVEYGFNRIVGAKKDDIINAEKYITSQKENFSIPLYGQGDAGHRIVETLLHNKNHISDQYNNELLK